MIFGFFALTVSPRIVVMQWHLPVGSSLWLALATLAVLGVLRVKLAERSTTRT
jgi:hypothetical protein